MLSGMARVTVRLFATVREAAGTASIQFEASDTQELVSKMRASFGREFSRMLDDADDDPDKLVVLLNGRNLGRALGKAVKLADGDELAMFPPVSGG